MNLAEPRSWFVIKVVNDRESWDVAPNFQWLATTSLCFLNISYHGTRGEVKKTDKKESGKDNDKKHKGRDDVNSVESKRIVVLNAQRAVWYEKAEMERSRSLLGSGTSLPPLTLETSNALLSPFGSHLRRWFENFFEDEEKTEGSCS